MVSPAAKYFSSVTVDELVAMIVSTVLPPGDLWSCFKEAAAVGEVLLSMNAFCRSVEVR